MSKVYASVLGLSLTVLFSLGVQARDASAVDVDDVTMDVIDNVRQFRLAGRAEARRLIGDFMLENGDITQAELDQLAAKRAVVRAELHTLRESGDREALRERLAELREARRARREEIGAYVASHDELAEIFQSRREGFRERLEERRDNR